MRESSQTNPAQSNVIPHIGAGNGMTRYTGVCYSRESEKSAGSSRSTESAVRGLPAGDAGI